jgi:hypothetical protein
MVGDRGGDGNIDAAAPGRADVPELVDPDFRLLRGFLDDGYDLTPDEAVLYDAYVDALPGSQKTDVIPARIGGNIEGRFDAMNVEAAQRDERSRVFAAQFVGLSLDLAISRATEAGYTIREISPRTKPTDLPDGVHWGVIWDSPGGRMTLFAGQDLVVHTSVYG